MGQRAANNDDGMNSQLKQARHPLQEHSVETYVGNDVLLGSSIGVLTGPNYSGKSALLKTIGLVVILAQIGCFVPASEAKMHIVDRLFTRIESFETNSALSESSFSIDIQQMASMVRNYTCHSLLLIDEFGKGTASADGASLLVACLEFFAKENCPRTMCATHFAEEIMKYKMLDHVPCVEYWQMQVMFCEDEERGGDQVVPLFQLIKGMTDQSYGIQCAQKADVPLSVIRRAQRLRDT